MEKAASMTKNLPSLLVALVDHAAIVKINGRANFTISLSFKRLVTELKQRGVQSFVLDLTDCITMDSTFLGVMAATALKLSEIHPASQNGTCKDLPASPLRLLNPNERVADLLDNLGISDLFRTVHSDTQAEAGPYLAPLEDSNPSRQELSQTCLEAHRLLMDLNPENIPKFREVALFLAEDLKKLNADSKLRPPDPVSGSACADAADPYTPPPHGEPEFVEPATAASCPDAHGAGPDPGRSRHG
jgi:anti-anti-sigma regulatory factor